MQDNILLGKLENALRYDPTYQTNPDIGLDALNLYRKNFAELI